MRLAKGISVLELAQMTGYKDLGMLENVLDYSPAYRLVGSLP